MQWPRRIERLRPLVVWESRGLPHDLILSIIKQESGGIIGRAGGTTVKPWQIPTVAGGVITYNRALGLMQVVPRTIASYNNRHPNTPVYYEQMSGETESDARIQIRVGSEILSKEIKNLHRYDPEYFPGTAASNTDTNQLLCAILAYRMGFGALTKKLKQLNERGLALTYQNIKNEFPNWGFNPETGNWINRPIHYTDTIWEAALNHGMAPGAPVNNIPGPEMPETQIASPGAPLGVLLGLGMLLWFFLESRK